MKKLLVLFASLVLVASFASAIPADCTMTTLTTYLASGYACKVDNLVFSNFSYSPTSGGSAGIIPASGIEVIPITIPGDEGLEFTGGWTVTGQGGINYQDSTILFSVDTLNGAPTINDIGLGFDGTKSGTGSAGVNELYCVGGGPIATCQNAGVINVPDPPKNNFIAPDQYFAPTTSLRISKDIVVSSVSEGVNNTATLSDVYNTYSQVPEPGTMCLIGGGLLALGFMRKRS